MIIREKLISTRAATILGRFPRHLGLVREDKIFAGVVHGLSRDLDIKTMQLGRVRKAHRLGQAEEIRDLLLLAGLHDLKPIRFEILRRRLAAIAAEGDILADDGADSAAREAALLKLGRLLPVADFGPYGHEENHDDLALALAGMTGFKARLQGLRHQIRELVRIHCQGNGSVRGLLEATAAYLHLEVHKISHTGDDYWHIAHCRDLIAISEGAQPAPAVSDDWLALEENPFKEEIIEPEEFKHGDIRKILRNGFDPVPINISVTGIADRACFPMIVDINKGHGLYYAGTVNDGAVLEFKADGRVLLDGVEADSHAFAFSGAVFAEDKGQTQASAPDFAFCHDNGRAPHGQAAFFVETEPVAQGFSAAPPFLGGLSPAISLAVGASYLKFFVRIAHFGEHITNPAGESYSAGILDSSLFALDQSGAGAEEGAALIGFDWEEREAFKAVLWLPSRLESYDREGETTLPVQLQPLLDRHRAAGIGLEIKYASDLWQLPYGHLTDSDSPQSYKAITAGSRLWNSGSPQPTI